MLKSVSGGPSLAIDNPNLPQPELPRELFLKEYTCPLSGETFKSVAVKSNAYSVRSRNPASFRSTRRCCWRTCSAVTARG